MRRPLHNPLTHLHRQPLSLSSFLFYSSPSNGGKPRLRSRYYPAKAMADVIQPSEACCTVPKVVARDYAEKGECVEINSMKTYVTGPSTATSAILFIYDVFGLSEQAKQGADILALADPARPYRVFVPDFLHGDIAPNDLFPSDTPEKIERRNAFFRGAASVPKAVGNVHAMIKAIGEREPGIQKWASLGFCWGGKIVSLTAQAGTPFSAAAVAHPSMISPEEAPGVSIPFCMLASKSEDANAVQAYEKGLQGEKYFETFADQVHGWMGARANLGDSRVKSEFERGYEVLLDFFRTYL